MRKPDAVRLQHMLDAAREAMSFAQGKTRVDLDTNRQLVLALVKEMEIVGEAACQLSAEATAHAPGIPWADIVGMRHRLVHAYFDVNLDVLWQTVQQDLPVLIRALTPLVSLDTTSGRRPSCFCHQARC
jgi:uncharacterized protein with HEPN domain